MSQSYASRRRAITSEAWKAVKAKEEAALALAQANAADCDRCQRRLETGQPYGPPHTASTPGHRPHCSCDGCY